MTGGVPRPSLEGVAELVTVMDRLRSPGGCPWDREQTHASLVPFAVEEAHELVEAVESGTREDLVEELGDVLLQVVFHARIAQEHPAVPFDVDDVARRTAAKLVSRHPHVFGDAHAPDAEAVKARWDEIKRSEKGRGSALDGVPPSLGAVARAAKLASRAQRAGIPLDPADDGVPPAEQGAPSGPTVGADYGERLLRLVLEATAAGADPEAELRRATRDWETRLRAAESQAAASRAAETQAAEPRSGPPPAPRKDADLPPKS